MRVLLGAIAIAAALTTGCAGTTPGATTGGEPVKVSYELTGTAKTVDVTFTTDGGTSTAQESDAKLPWRKNLELERESLLIVQVMGQNKGAKGTVKCSIKVDGKVVKSNTSSGGYAIASCDHTID